MNKRRTVIRKLAIGLGAGAFALGTLAAAVPSDPIWQSTPSKVSADPIWKVSSSTAAAQDDDPIWGAAPIS